jgi:hypothetical protein
MAVLKGKVELDKDITPTELDIGEVLLVRVNDKFVSKEDASKVAKVYYSFDEFLVDTSSVKDKKKDSTISPMGG